MTEPRTETESLAATSGREAQPRDRGDVADNAERADRIDRHNRAADDAAGMGTGDAERAGAD